MRVETPPRPAAWKAGPAMLVAAAAFAAHARSLGGGLVYDDRQIVLEDPRIRSLLRIGEFFGSGYWSSWIRGRLYRPLSTLSLALDWFVHGPSPLGYHVVNVALHALNATLLFKLLRRIWPEKEGLCAGAAMLFAVHAALSEPVSEAVGRADLLAATFSLLSLLAVLAGARPVLAAAAAFLAFLSKESALPLVLALPAAHWVAARDGAAGDGSRARSRLVRIGLGAFVAAALYVGLRSVALRSEPDWAALTSESGPVVENPIRDADVGTRVLTATAVLGRYASILAWPVRLRSDASFDEIPAVRSPLDPWCLLGMTALGLLGLGLVLGFRARDPLCLAALLVAGPLAVTSNILFPIGTLYGERLLYLPVLGIAALLPALVSRRAAGRPIVVAAFAAATVLLSLRTVVREGIYANESAFFEAMVRDSPRSAKAWMALANHYREIQDVASERAALERALEIHPTYPQALVGIGMLDARAGDVDRAESRYLAAIEASPYMAEAHVLLGQIYRDREHPDLERAEQHLRDACRFRPDLAEAPYALGWVLLKKRQFPEADAAFDESLRRRPGYAYGLYGRGASALMRGDVEAAAPWLKEAAASDPGLRSQILAWLDQAAARPEVARLRDAIAAGK